MNYTNMTEKQLRQAIKKMLIESSDYLAAIDQDGEPNDNLINLIRARTGSLKSAIAGFHDLLRGGGALPNRLLDDVAAASRDLDLDKPFTDQKYIAAVPWVTDFLSTFGASLNPTAQDHHGSSLPAGQIESAYVDSAISYLGSTDVLKGKNSKDPVILSIVNSINTNKPGSMSFTQATLQIMASNTFSFNDKADEWEIAMLLIATHYLGSNGTFEHTQTASAGVDISGPLKFEVKSSITNTPQTEFSASIPSAESNKYYFFITTERCYLVESRILRDYFLNVTSTPQSFQVTTTKGVNLDKEAVTNALNNTDTLKQKLLGLKTGQDVLNAIVSDNTLAGIYDAILHQVDQAREDIAGLVLQVIAGIDSDGGRIKAPAFGIGALNVGFRVKSQRSLGTLKGEFHDIIKDLANGDVSNEINLSIQGIHMYNQQQNKSNADMPLGSEISKSSFKKLKTRLLDLIRISPVEEVFDGLTRGTIDEILGDPDVITTDIDEAIDNALGVGITKDTQKQNQLIQSNKYSQIYAQGGYSSYEEFLIAMLPELYSAASLRVVNPDVRRKRRPPNPAANIPLSESKIKLSESHMLRLARQLKNLN